MHLERMNFSTFFFLRWWSLEHLVPAQKKKVNDLAFFSLNEHKKIKNPGLHQEGQKTNTKHKLILLWNYREAPFVVLCGVIATDIKDTVGKSSGRCHLNGPNDGIRPWKTRKLGFFNLRKMNVQRMIIKMNKLVFETDSSSRQSWKKKE